MNSLDSGLKRPFENCGIDCSENKYVPDRALLMDALSGVLNDIEKFEGNVLFIVNCTRKKAFHDTKNECNKENKDNRDYIPAGCAYCGSSFMRFKYFLNELEKKMKEKNIDYPIYWIILSAKYGFIEPDHPIHNYNVAFDYEETGPISILSLIRQATRQKRRWKIRCNTNNNSHVYVTKKLIEFDKIYVYTKNVYYLLAVAIIFGTKVRRIILTRDDNQLEDIKDLGRLKIFIYEIADALKFYQ